MSTDKNIVARKSNTHGLVGRPSIVLLLDIIVVASRR